jgi:hypothetical protein
MRTQVLFAAAICGAMLASEGRAALIDFEDTTSGAVPESWLDQGRIAYEEEGFRFSITVTEDNEDNDTYFVPDGANEYLYHESAGVAFTIVAIGGESFTFSPFEAFTFDDTALLDLTGQKAGGGTVSYTTSVSNGVFQPIVLLGDWTNLQQVDIVRRTTGEGGSTNAGYDNFNLQIDEAVPEPGTLVLWSLGALGCALARQKRARRRLA